MPEADAKPAADIRWRFPEAPLPRGFAPFSPGVENITVNSTPKKPAFLTAYAERLLAKKNFRLTYYIADHPLVRFELGF
jgi:hypothetical protein